MYLYSNRTHYYENLLFNFFHQSSQITKTSALPEMASKFANLFTNLEVFTTFLYPYHKSNLPIQCVLYISHLQHNTISSYHSVMHTFLILQLANITTYISNDLPFVQPANKLKICYFEYLQVTWNVHLIENKATNLHISSRFANDTNGITNNPHGKYTQPSQIITKLSVKL